MYPQDHPNQPPAEHLLGSFFSGKVRWFFLSLLLFFLLFLCLSWLIRYPDAVLVRVMIHAEGDVQRYYAGFPGRIASIPASNGQEVDSGAVLLVWENGAGWEDVVRLAGLEMPWSEDEIAQIGRLRLGPLAEQWALAHSAWRGLQSAKASALSPALSPLRGQQRAALEEMETALRRRAGNLKQEAGLAKDLWERSQRLAAQKALSEEALIRSEGEYLRKIADAEVAEMELQRVSLDLAELEKEQLEWAHADTRVLDEKKERWESAWNLLQVYCDDWIEQNLVVARRSGRVAFSRPLQDMHWVDEGEPLLAIHTADSQPSYIAKGWLPAAWAGKVKPGAEVQLRLDAFPYQSYGYAAGKVIHLSPLSENESFLVEIEAMDSLISGAGKNLVSGLEMPATARILTSKRRLLERISDALKRR